MQIVQELQNALGKDVACVIDAKHLCVIQEESVTSKVAQSLLNWWKI
jgi:GTP cyclohydrolase I